MTDEQAAEIEERCRKATPGPWGIESCGEKGDGSNMIGVLYDEDDMDCERPMSGWVPECRPGTGDFIEYYRDELVAECEHRNRNSHADATFIAHARTDIPALLAERKALKEALMLALKQINHFTHNGTDKSCPKCIAVNHIRAALTKAEGK